ncbi:hypothetical protein CDAR_445921 [Caerostris darwini]|uniref:Uncharacterized protein n=1 Tax=Caerostris darwini TaxID=1538125 RepID=A0AAV4U0F7_9ARAC|nr:hypothetical protein CDAR_445921 [Caerostris darwini]
MSPFYALLVDRIPSKKDELSYFVSGSSAKRKKCQRIIRQLVSSHRKTNRPTDLLICSGSLLCVGCRKHCRSAILKTRTVVGWVREESRADEGGHWNTEIDSDEEVK